MHFGKFTATVVDCLIVGTFDCEDDWSYSLDGLWGFVKGRLRDGCGIDGIFGLTCMSHKQ